MSKKTFAIVLILAIATFGLTLGAPSAQSAEEASGTCTFPINVPNGPYQHSCKDCSFVADTNKFSCECKNDDDDHNLTTIILSECTADDNGFVALNNDDGDLKCM